MGFVTKSMLSYDKFRISNSKSPEYLVFSLFAFLYCFVTVHHEPWFDEAQVWQIAKCASIFEMLFEIPHYEGHPAFWSLILAIPAKLGVPFEIGLKTIGFIISAATVYIILFKSSFPRIAKLILPFTYFVFYQYGVIVRPYGLALLLFLILANVFQFRHEKPWMFIGVLMLLCLTGAYTIVISGGIATCFVLEIFEEKGIRRLFAEWRKDRRVHALLMLLVLAVTLILEIMPRSDTLVTSKGASNNPFLLCFIIAMFTFIGESTLTTGSWFAQDAVLLQQAHFDWTELVAFIILGIFLWIVIIAISSRKMLKYIIVPYLFFSIFAAGVYYSVHHIGVVYAFLLFWLEALFIEPDRYEIGNTWVSSLAKKQHDKKILEYSVKIVLLACLLIPVYWCVSACILDIQKEYSCGRTVSRWIQENKLENCSFLNVWGQGEYHEDPDSRESLLYNNTYIVGMPVEICAYFDHNICFNLNFGRDSEAYMHYKVATREENETAIQEWRKAGVPDILLQKPRLQDIYGDELSYNDYCIVKILPEHRIWKNYTLPSYTPIFARNDIAEKYGLEPIQENGFDYYVNGFQITDEMKAQYENGVPVEEILKPYLDAMFGEE